MCKKKQRGEKKGKSINNAYKMKGRSVANLISEINGAAQHVRANCGNIRVRDIFRLLKRSHYALDIIRTRTGNVLSN